MGYESFWVWYILQTKENTKTTSSDWVYLTNTIKEPTIFSRCMIFKDDYSNLKGSKAELLLESNHDLMLVVK